MRRNSLRQRLFARILHPDKEATALKTAMAYYPRFEMLLRGVPDRGDWKARLANLASKLELPSSVFCGKDRYRYEPTLWQV